MSRFIVLMGGEALAAVEEINPSCERETFFQNRDWLALWGGRSGYKTAVCLLESANKMISYLPFCIRKRLGFSECYSMPMGTYGGAVNLDDEYSAIELAQEFIRWCDDQKLVRVNVIEYSAEENSAYSGFVSNSPTTHILDMTADDAILHRNLSTNHRRNIDKATESNLAVVPVKSISDVEVYYALVKESANRHGSKPKYDFTFYVDMLSTIASERMIWQIVYSDDRACCGHIYFRWNDEVIYWDGCSSEVGLQLRANFHLFWQNILGFKHDGICKLNFGASPPSAGSLIDFKKGWGAKPVSYYEYDRQRKLYGGFNNLMGKFRE